MDTTLLKSFLTLAKTKNFTKAAQKLHRSQSALSLQIGRLEEMLGKKVFERTLKSVSLTPEGEELIGYAQQLLSFEEEMLARFQSKEVSGEVRLGTPEDLATSYLPQILARFAKTYPRVLLQVDCEFSLPLLQKFEEGIYDLVLIKQDPRKPHSCSEEVWKESLVWVSSQKSPPPLNPLPLILAPSPCVYRQRALDALHRAGIRWKIVYTSPSLAGALAAVKAGLGVSILPVHQVPADLFTVRQLPPLQDAQIALLKREGSTEAAKALATYIVEHIV